MKTTKVVTTLLALLISACLPGLAPAQTVLISEGPEQQKQHTEIESSDTLFEGIK